MMHSNDKISRHLNERQLLAINRIGDVFIPGTSSGKILYPRFSSTSCTRAVDRILDYTPESDLNDLKLLLFLLSYFPKFLLRFLIAALELSPQVPSFSGGSLLRLIRIGLRGLIFSLYYADPAVLQQMKYHVSVYTKDLPADQTT